MALGMRTDASAKFEKDIDPMHDTFPLSTARASW